MKKTQLDRVLDNLNAQIDSLQKTKQMLLDARDATRTKVTESKGKRKRNRQSETLPLDSTGADVIPS